MKKFLINEQEKSRILKMYNVNSNLIKEGVTIPYSQVSVYDAGSSDPSKFIDEFVKNLIAKIDSDAAAKAMRLSGQMVLAKGFFTGGASNSWGKMATGYDRENNMAQAKPTETVNYQKNYDLALERAKKFEEALWPKLAVYKIKKSPDLSVIKTSAYVLNTGGKGDSSRDQKTFPNPGQKIYVNLVFEYSQKLEESKDATKITSLDQFRNNFVLTGSYYCNGKNGLGSPSSSTDTYVNQCSKLPANLKDGNHISAWEIKWNPNVMKNPYTVPVYRWNFYWGADGKIKTIVGQQYNNDVKYPANKLFPPSQNVAKDDKTLLYMMGLNDGETTTGGKLYGKLIKPFI
jgi:hypothetical protein